MHRESRLGRRANECPGVGSGDELDRRDSLIHTFKGNVMSVITDHVLLMRDKSFPQERELKPILSVLICLINKSRDVAS